MFVCPPSCPPDTYCEGCAATPLVHIGLRMLEEKVDHLLVGPGDGLHEAGHPVLVAAVGRHPDREGLLHDGIIPVPAGGQEQAVPRPPRSLQLPGHPSTDRQRKVAWVRKAAISGGQVRLGVIKRFVIIGQGTDTE